MLLVFLLSCIHAVNGQSRCMLNQIPFYPPFCFNGPRGGPEGVAFPDTIIDHNIVTMPNNQRVGSWGNILIADTGNNRIVEINPGDNNTNGNDYEDYEDNLQTTDFDAITFQLGYYMFNNDYTTNPHPIPLRAAEPAPCSYEPDHSVNGPVWASWMQTRTALVNENGPETALLLAVVAGFDGCPDNRVRVFLVTFRNCYNGNSYDYGGNGGWEEYGGYARANCSRGLWSFGSRFPGPGLDELDHPTHAIQLRLDINAGDDPDLGEGENADDYGFSDYLCNDFGCTLEGCREIEDVELNSSFSETNVNLYNGDILVTDQGNNRILLVDFCTQKVEWWYGPKHGPSALKHPSMTQLLLNGHILIADTGNQRVVEITIQGMFVDEFVMTGSSRPLMVSLVEYLSPDNCGCDSDGYNCDANACMYSQYCQNEYCFPRNTDFDKEMGSRLIVDSGNNTLIQYDKNGRVQFTHGGDFGKLMTAFRVMHKDFYLLTDRDRHTVSVWNRFKSVTVWRYSDLNNPSSAVMVGEETGMSRSGYWSIWFWN